MSSILIIIPTYNESQNIADLVIRLTALYGDADVLVVDDGSPDGTADTVQALAKINPRVLLLRRGGKGGRGSAVLDGFRFGLKHSYTTFVEMDADFSHRPEEVRTLLDRLQTCDMVVGSRYLPGSEIHEWGIKRTVFSSLANRFARLMLAVPLSDYTNGFRAYRRSAIEALQMDRIDAKGYVVLSEVAMQLFLANQKIGEVPTVFVNRRRGISNLTRREISEAFLSVLRIRRMYRSRSAAH